MRAHDLVHREAARIAAHIVDARPDAAHAAFHAPAFTAAVAELLQGLDDLGAQLSAAA